MTPDTVFIVLLGAVLAAAFVALVRHRQAERRAFALGLVVAALVYIPLALAGGEPQAALVELTGVALFTLFAWLGWRHSALWLATGWVLHVAWDLLLHPSGPGSWWPAWYPALCVGFDLFVAGAAAVSKD